MYSKRFEKETFKNDVKENVRTLYRKEIEEATPQQIFQARSEEHTLNSSHPNPSRMPSSA